MRKNEHLKNDYFFCNALVKRKTVNKNIYYILEKGHSNECLNRLITYLKFNTKNIGNYKKFSSECNEYLNKF